MAMAVCKCNFIEAGLLHFPHTPNHRLLASGTNRSARIIVVQAGGGALCCSLPCVARYLMVTIHLPRIYPVSYNHAPGMVQSCTNTHHSPSSSSLPIDKYIEFPYSHSPHTILSLGSNDTDAEQFPAPQGRILADYVVYRLHTHDFLPFCKFWRVVHRC